MREIIAVMTPLLLHMLFSEAAVILTAVLFGPGADSALATAIASLLVLPVGSYLYRKDRGMAGAGLRPVQKQSGRKAVWSTRLGKAALCFLAGGIMNLVWSRTMQLFQLQEHFSNAVQEQLLAGQAVVQILGLGLLVPAAEELIFRGLIYSRMKRLLSVRQSVFFSALLFAVYHGNMIQIIFVFPMALILAVVYEKGRWLGYPVSFHMGANLTAVLVNLFFAG